MSKVAPPRWSTERLTIDAAKARAQFAETRMEEPLEHYLDRFKKFRLAVDELIEETIALRQLREHAVDLLIRPEMKTAIRFLASPWVSEDDLKVLADTTLSPARLRADGGAGALRVIETVLRGLDSSRFPWISEEREPTDMERQIAVVSTAALIATQGAQTDRRNESKNEQERKVSDYVASQGFTQVPTRTIATLSDAPEPGEFCHESMFGTQKKADLVVRLWDGRVMPIECKVSNSSINSVKRLNNDAAVKAGIWLGEFGTLGVVPTAALSGVFKVHNLESAQKAGLTIIWAHNLAALGKFFDATKP